MEEEEEEERHAATRSTQAMEEKRTFWNDMKWRNKWMLWNVTD